MSEKKDTGRTAKLQRNTAETQISLRLNLDGKGPGEIRTGCGFLDHMLTLFSRHASMDLSVICRGDTDVDFHHSTEDIGICLGKALKEALGDCCGIRRYGSVLLPMDESLILCAIDISGGTDAALFAAGAVSGESAVFTWPASGEK